MKFEMVVDGTKEVIADESKNDISVKNGLACCNIYSQDDGEYVVMRLTLR